MRYYLRLLKILYKDHKTNEEIRRKIATATEEYEDLPALVNKQEVSLF